MADLREVPFTEDPIGASGGAGSKLTWKLQRGEVGMWASKPLNSKKTIHIAGVSLLDVTIEGTNLADRSHPLVLREAQNLEKIAGEGIFVVYENTLFFRPVCRDGVDVEVVAIVTA